MPPRLLLTLLLLVHDSTTPSSSLDFIFNSFNSTGRSLLTLTDDARIEPPVVRLTNDSNQFSLGRAFHPTAVPFKNFTAVTASFSTQFVFSVLPEISTSPGFGLAFVMSAAISPPNALAGQYLGLFSTNISVGPLIAIEFDMGRNQEFNDPDGNHVGVDLNSPVSAAMQSAGYYSTNGTFIAVDMRNGQNIHVWIDFNGPETEVNVTLAPAGLTRPARTLLSYKDPAMANYSSAEMFVGFSASKTEWVEAQRILAWSFNDAGQARDLNTTNLPIFTANNASPAPISGGAVVGIVVGAVLALLPVSFFAYWLWRRKRKGLKDSDEIEDWEMEYWPHRYSYEELTAATNGFGPDELLGSGGFGKVYKGTLENGSEIAVKCVSHDSKQGLREFMAEISSIGRLQHKNLVQIRGWCRKSNELMLVYDYMPNGSLNNWIFNRPKTLMGWAARKRVLADVAEGLNYLHHGWDQVVVHRDIKSSNILLDSEMRARLGDFGLAKLYTQGEAPKTTRVVGTLGYLAPEVATLAAPTEASDVYSFGVVVLEVVCGRRPIEVNAVREDDEVLIDLVRRKYLEGKLVEVVDGRIEGEYEVGEVEMVLKLGLACCHPDPLRRPGMKDVVEVLVGEGSAIVPKDLLSGLSPGGGDDGGGGEAFGV